MTETKREYRDYRYNILSGAKTKEEHEKGNPSCREIRVWNHENPEKEQYTKKESKKDEYIFLWCFVVILIALSLTFPEWTVPILAIFTWSWAVLYDDFHLWRLMTKKTKKEK